jgi:3-dehydroshikimate dehydratase
VRSFQPGLVSITFRKLNPADVVALCQESSLQLIEWGGDIHVPAGDRATAEEVRSLTEQAGLTTSCYGSYWRAEEDAPFEPVLQSAIALGAPKIRIWPGAKSSERTSDIEWAEIRDRILFAADQAEAHGISLTLEIHPNTLTDYRQPALRLLTALEKRVSAHWQPSPYLNPKQNIDFLQLVAPFISGFHVFHWLTKQGEVERRPLTEGLKDWQHFLSLAPPGRHPLMLEFVRGDEPGQLNADAAALHQLAAQLNRDGSA